MVLEFLGIPENNDFRESGLEKAIINHLQKFLMELGKGYAFIGRQVSIHTEKEDYTSRCWPNGYVCKNV